MKALRALLLPVVILAAGGFLYWTWTQPEIPVTRMLTNAEGKTLEATIVGKTGGILHLDRAGDGMRFELPVDKLSKQDQWFAFRLPEQDPPAAVVKEPEDPYIASRRARIEELKKKQAALAAEIKSGAIDGMLARKRKDDLLAVDAEIKELQAAINIRLAQEKKK